MRKSASLVVGALGAGLLLAGALTAVSVEPGPTAPPPATAPVPSAPPVEAAAAADGTGGVI
ncbi:hypothetical protein QDK53_35430, partial [Amycolatopsis magusensis]|nr:hypothetical protein [Amycolatopsis magusensis]